MKYRKEKRAALSFVGLSARTSNAREMSKKGIICRLWQQFYKETVSEKIFHVCVEGDAYGVYYEYPNANPDTYSVLVGVNVSRIDTVPAGLAHIELPPSDYFVFTTPQGAMPDIIIQSWAFIHDFFAKQTEYVRTYTGDFEHYDGRAQDTNNACVDIYVAVKKRKDHGIS